MKCKNICYVDEVVLISAFRYALGRATYVVSEVAKAIECNMDRLSPNMIRLIIKEISEAEYLGMQMDAEVWTDLKNKLKSYIKE